MEMIRTTIVLRTEDDEDGLLKETMMSWAEFSRYQEPLAVLWGMINDDREQILEVKKERRLKQTSEERNGRSR
jgi:hypothetical protein